MDVVNVWNGYGLPIPFALANTPPAAISSTGPAGPAQADEDGPGSEISLPAGNQAQSFTSLPMSPEMANGESAGLSPTNFDVRAFAQLAPQIAEAIGSFDMRRICQLLAPLFRLFGLNILDYPPCSSMDLMYRQSQLGGEGYWIED